MRVVRRSLQGATTRVRPISVKFASVAGRRPTPGRPQGCAPTMLRSTLPGSSIVGAMACPIDSNKIVQEQVMQVVRRSLQGDHSRARTSHRPYYATHRLARFVHSRGDGLSSPWVGPEHGDNRVSIAFANKVPCGRPVGVPIRLSSSDKQMEELIGINVACPRPEVGWSPCWGTDSSLLA
jgi:hypothetical protein